jgi:hypothetical protein
MLSIDIKDLSPLELQNYLHYAIAPRPVCLASTIDTDGNVNLSPFSFLICSALIRRFVCSRRRAG